VISAPPRGVGKANMDRWGEAEIRDKEIGDKEIRDKEIRDKEIRDKEIGDKEIRDKEIRDRGLSLISCLFQSLISASRSLTYSCDIHHPER
jgi:hypothetical protein